MKVPSAQQLASYRKSIEQFVQFTDEEWDIFRTHLQLKTLKKKDFLAEAGKICSEVGYIVKGTLRYFHVKDGEEVTNYFSFEGELTSSYISFLTGQPSATYIEAIENAEILIFNKKSLEELQNNPAINLKMERFGRMVAEFYLCCYDSRVISLLTQTPEERYLSLLKERNDIISRIPQHYIANYLGITPVSLSRIRSRIMKPQASLLKVLQ